MAVNIGYEVDKMAHGQVSLPIIVPAMIHTHSSITKGQTMAPLKAAFTDTGSGRHTTIKTDGRDIKHIQA